MSLPTAPPPELIDKLAAAAYMRWRSEQDAIPDYPTWQELADESERAAFRDWYGAILTAIWPDVLALAATQHDQEQQLRQTVADEIRALSVSDRIQRQEERFDEPCDAEHWECHAAAAGMAFAMAVARAQRGQESS